MIVEVLGHADVLPALRVGFLFAQNFGDSWHFAGAHEKIYFGQFFGQCLRVTLRQTTGNDKLLDLS
jgi:hypothetical protein